MEQRRHGRGSARLLQGGNRGGFSRPGDPRQPLKARRRDAFWRRWTQIEGADRLEPVEVEEEFAGGALSRHGPQSIQCGKPGFAGLVEQCCDPRTLFLVERRNQALPKALLRPVSYAADKAFKDGDAWQQHLVDEQPGRGALDQRAGMVIATPAQRIQPSRQAKPGQSVVGKLGKAIALTDQDQVSNALAAVVEIALEPGLWLQPQLVDQKRRDRAGDIKISAGKGAQEPGRPQHQGKAEAIVVTPQPIDDLPIASVQMEIPRQLIRRRCCGKTGVALPLLVGQVASGHIVRNLGLLRRVRRARRFKDIFLAKYLCGTRHFSNMFCEAREALA